MAKYRLSGAGHFARAFAASRSGRFRRRHTELDQFPFLALSHPLHGLREATRHIKLNQLCHDRTPFMELFPLTSKPCPSTLVSVAEPFPSALAAGGIAQPEFLQKSLTDRARSHPHGVPL